jgi:tryptophan 2,3-dioxygenase
MAAIEWLKAGRWAYAAGCLHRAARLAQFQLDTLLVLRRTMSVDRFLGFREATGEASAVQTVSGQLLNIHLMGVHPRRVEALAQVPENAYLLLHVNPAFEPLRKALGRVPRDSEPAAEVFSAARRLDDLLFRWRRVHLGLAHRYLPKDAGGSGGTAGAPYLQGLYQDRLFDGAGDLVPQLVPEPLPALGEWVRARPPFSPLN